jgi:hypothetical protein
MYASASTWAFNAVRATAAVAAPGVAYAAAYADTYKQLAALPAGRPHVVKTHQLDERATAFLQPRATNIVLSIRDPRDGVVSLMQHMRFPFGNAVDWIERSAVYTGKLAADERTLLLKYEDGFVDDPATFDRFAALFGATLDPAQRAALFEGSRRAVIEAKIARLEELPTSFADKRSGDVVDNDTQWHRHHANRTGEVGRWRRMLPPEAIKVIESRLAGWMANFGYEPG